METDAGVSIPGNFSGQSNIQTNNTSNVDESYNLEGEKIALLFLHQTFYDDYSFDRSYVKDDGEKLHGTLELLGFDVNVFYDCDGQTLIQKIKEISSNSVKKYGCIFVYVSSRGKNETIYTKHNIEFSTDRITEHLRDSKLAGVPKVVIFQTTMDNDMESDGGYFVDILQPNCAVRVIKIPKHADFLVVKLATSEKFVRMNPQEIGSMFITILSEMLQNYSDKMDIKRILVLTNNLFLNQRIAMPDRNSTNDFITFTDTQRKLLFLK